MTRTDRNAQSSTRSKPRVTRTILHTPLPDDEIDGVSLGRGQLHVKLPQFVAAKCMKANLIAGLTLRQQLFEIAAGYA